MNFMNLKKKIALLLLFPLLLALLTGCGLFGAAKTPITRLSQRLVEACEEQYGIVIPEDAVLKTGAYVDDFREGWIVLVFTLPAQADNGTDSSSAAAELSRRLRLGAFWGGVAPNGDGGFMEEFGGRMDYKIAAQSGFGGVYYTQADQQTLRVRFVGWRPDFRITEKD